MSISRYRLPLWQPINKNLSISDTRRFLKSLMYYDTYLHLYILE